MRDAIRLEGISKQIGQRQILKNVTFAVEQGDIFGYLGPNGAGKTTTIRVILGLMQATAGTVSILGRSASDDKTRQNFGFVLEFDGLYDNMTARGNLEYYARIYGVSQPRDRIDRALDMVKLSDRAGDKVGTYSKGMRQRLALARSMIHDPAVLILDEPTAGVDPTGQIEVRQIILDMAHKESKTVFLSSHNLDEVSRICNRIALIHKGELRLYGDLEKLRRERGKGLVTIETLEPVAGSVLSELRARTGVSIHDSRDRTLVLSIGQGNAVGDIVSFLAQRGVKIEQVKREEASLEEIYTTILKEAEQRQG